MANRKSTSGFPTSYRYSAYLPLSPQNTGSKSVFCFSNKLQPLNLKCSVKVTYPVKIAELDLSAIAELLVFLFHACYSVYGCADCQ